MIGLISGMVIGVMIGWCAACYQLNKKFKEINE